MVVGLVDNCVTVRPWIGHEWQDGAGGLEEVRNQARPEEVVARVQLAAPEQIDNSETTGLDPHLASGGRRQSGFGPPEYGWETREFLSHPITVYMRSTG